MSGVSGYEDYCGNRAALECPYSSCDGCPVKDAAKPKVDALKAENARLRELVRDMCEWAYIDSYCDLEGRFADRMRELGVEVDG